jgi:two-component system, OmpR family, sensor histidine kinase CreC
MSTTLRVIIASLAVLAGGFYYLIDRLLQRVERQYLEAAEEPMVDAANLVAALLEGHLKGADAIDVEPLRKAWQRMPERQIDARIYDIVKTTMDMDVYVVDHAGVCVFDSRGRDEGKGMLSMRDVALTLVGSYGARSTREVPEDDRTSIMFVGAPIRAGGKIIGAVSVIKPQFSMFEFIHQTQRAIRTTGWSIFGAVGVVAVFLSWWLLRPLQALGEYAQAVARGERARLPALSGSEAVALGRSFEAMRDALEDRNYVETYVQSLTHEMKSPVAAIRGSVELLSEPGMQASAQQRFLDHIRAEAGRMQRIIDRLLTLSEFESRKTLEKPEVLNFSTLVRAVVEGLRPAFDARRIRLEVDAVPNAMVRGDALLLEMAVDNLLQNALEFTPADGRVAVRVLVREESEVAVTVEDDGPGVPHYALERVFERFYSLEHPVTGRKSSGLGLCFVREAADLHHGQATLVNRQGTPGAVATFVLPAA